MASTYIGFGSKVTPQSEPIPGSDQVANSAGGFSFAVDNWKRLERFLVLGSEGGSYYASERALTKENAKAVEDCIKADGKRVVDAIVTISDAGRAPKNDPALFALAMCASLGDDQTRAYALANLQKVARIGTHLMHFAAYVDQFRGWGRGLRRAIGNWFLSKDASSVAFQSVKYQSRDKWAQRDLLRLGHPKTDDAALNAVFKWIVDGWPDIGNDAPTEDYLKLIWAFEKAKRTTNTNEIAGLIRDYRLPREGVPTEALNDKDVWLALLDEPMPMTAMIRNLATMTRVGLFQGKVSAIDKVVSRLQDEQTLKRARVHPIQILSALKTYAQGHGERSKNTWEPVRQIVDALDAAFYASFQNVERTGKRILLALDVSGSMGSALAGVPGLTARDGSAAMALITAATEPNYQVVAFASGGGNSGPYGRYGSYSAFLNGQKKQDPDTGLTPLTVSPRQRLDDVVKTISNMPFGGTDCALPMLYAIKRDLEFDAFVIYTDSETWAGAIHPMQALKQYRAKTGIAAKLVTVGMVSNGFTIGDPNDAGALDVVGFDSSAPAVISQFIAQ